MEEIFQNECYEFADCEVMTSHPKIEKVKLALCVFLLGQSSFQNRTMDLNKE